MRAWRRPAHCGPFIASLVSMVAAFLCLNLPMAVTSTAFGVALQAFLSDPVRARRRTPLMAALLLASAVPIIAEIDAAVRPG